MDAARQLFERPVSDASLAASRPSEDQDSVSVDQSDAGQVETLSRGVGRIHGRLGCPDPPTVGRGLLG
jgi:hypothetical protein